MFKTTLDRYCLFHHFSFMIVSAFIPEVYFGYHPALNSLGGVPVAELFDYIKLIDNESIAVTGVVVMGGGVAMLYNPQGLWEEFANGSLASAADLKIRCVNTRFTSLADCFV